MRDSQEPDQHGTVIPIDAKAGQVQWSVIGADGHAMIGRSEYVSQAHGIAGVAFRAHEQDSFHPEWQ
jgi:hypothetical protein